MPGAAAAAGRGVSRAGVRRGRLRLSRPLRAGAEGRKVAWPPQRPLPGPPPPPGITGSAEGPELLGQLPARTRRGSPRVSPDGGGVARREPGCRLGSGAGPCADVALAFLKGYREVSRSLSAKVLCRLRKLGILG